MASNWKSTLTQDRPGRADLALHVGQFSRYAADAPLEVGHFALEKLPFGPELLESALALKDLSAQVFRLAAKTRRSEQGSGQQKENP